MYVVQKQAGTQESSGPFPAECNWPTASFPLSDWAALFHRQPGSHCAKPGQIRFGSGWLCRVLAQQIQSRSKHWLCRVLAQTDPVQKQALTVSGFGPTDPVQKQVICAGIIRPASSQCFRADLDWMQIRPGMFTGKSDPACLLGNQTRHVYWVL